MNLVTTKEYAGLCGVSETAIRNRIQAKKIKPTERGGYYFIDTEKFPPMPAAKGGRPSAEQVRRKMTS